MRSALYTLALASTLALFFAGCDLGSKTADPLKMKAPVKLWESVVPGLPMGSTHRLGGWYKVRYIEADPYDELKSNMIIWCTWLAGIAGFCVLLGCVGLYYKVPFAKDVIIISLIFFLGAFALALIVQYMTWIFIGCGVAIAGYFGYVCWREHRHRQEKQQDEQIHEELVTTGTLLKGFTKWDHTEKRAVEKVQSPLTTAKVKALEGKAKAKAAEILQQFNQPAMA
jgi:hypothetical protein